MDIRLIIASHDDAETVAEIGRTTFYESWRHMNTEEDMQLYMKDAFAFEKIKSDISNKQVNLFLLAQRENESIGYAKMRRVRPYDEFKGEKAIEIERIYVRKVYQKKKVGKLLMDKCIELAKSENSQWLWLGVNEDNAGAISFYKKYGFEIFGNKMFKLGEAEDNDYLMKLKLI